MTHTSTKENTSTTANREGLRGGAAELGDPSSPLVRSIERHLNGEAEPTIPEAVMIPAPQRGRTALRSFLARVRNHRGYKSTLSEQALDRIRPAVRDLRR